MTHRVVSRWRASIGCLFPDLYCRPHENAYNPWYRIYLMKFEDALRSVKDCEDVTMPYWDITEDKVPPVLYKTPFKDYTIPRELRSLTGEVYARNHVTDRYPAKQVIKNIKVSGNFNWISDAIAVPFSEPSGNLRCRFHQSV